VEGARGRMKNEETGDRRQEAGGRRQETVSNRCFQFAKHPPPARSSGPPPPAGDNIYSTIHHQPCAADVEDITGNKFATTEGLDFIIHGYLLRLTAGRISNMAGRVRPDLSDIKQSLSGYLIPTRNRQVNERF
jgi:hypothetical protein